MNSLRWMRNSQAARLVPGWKLWRPVKRLDHRVVNEVIRRVAIARQRQRIDPQPRKDRLQLLVEIVNVVCSSRWP